MAAPQVKTIVCGNCNMDFLAISEFDIFCEPCFNALNEDFGPGGFADEEVLVNQDVGNMTVPNFGGLYNQAFANVGGLVNQGFINTGYFNNQAFANVNNQAFANFNNQAFANINNQAMVNVSNQTFANFNNQAMANVESQGFMNFDFNNHQNEVGMGGFDNKPVIDLQAAKNYGSTDIVVVNNSGGLDGEGSSSAVTSSNPQQQPQSSQQPTAAQQAAELLAQASFMLSKLAPPPRASKRKRSIKDDHAAQRAAVKAQIAFEAKQAPKKKRSYTKRAKKASQSAAPLVQPARAQGPGGPAQQA